MVRRLGLDLGVLTLAGTVFTPEDRGFVRFSYANIEPAQIDELARRLSGF